MVRKTLLKVFDDRLTLSDVELGRANDRASFAPSKSAAYFQTLCGSALRKGDLYLNPMQMHTWSELSKGGVVVQVTTEVGSVTYTWSINVAAVLVILVGSVTICERWKLDVAACSPI